MGSERPGVERGMAGSRMWNWDLPGALGRAGSCGTAAHGAAGRLCLLLIWGFLCKNCQSWALSMPLAPPALGWLQGKGGRSQFLLSDPLCPRVSDLDRLNLQIILHSPRNNFLSQLQPRGWLSPRDRVFSSGLPFL